MACILARRREGCCGGQVSDRSRPCPFKIKLTVEGLLRKRLDVIGHTRQLDSTAFTLNKCIASGITAQAIETGLAGLYSTAEFIVRPATPSPRKITYILQVDQGFTIRLTLWEMRSGLGLICLLERGTWAGISDEETCGADCRVARRPTK